MRPADPARRFLIASLALTTAWLAGCAGATPKPAPMPAAAPAPIHLRVMAFNDFHGHLEPGNLSLTLNHPQPDPARPANDVLRVPAGGAPALAGLVGALRQGAPHRVLISAGDMFGASPLVSSLFRHESTIEVLNQLGLDVAAAGNHEFDAGSAELLRLLKGGCAVNAPQAATASCALTGQYGGARFPMLAANVHTANGLLLAPSWVRSYGGVKVGFIGAITRNTPRVVVPSAVAGLRFEEEAAAINRAADALAAQGVRAMVAVLHEGGTVGGFQQPVDWNDQRCANFRGPIVEIAQRITPQVALILSAHTHQGYNCLVDGRPVMQAFSFGRGLAVVDLVIDARSGEVDRAATRSRNLPVLNEHTEPAMREALAKAEPAGLADALRRAQPAPAVSQAVAAYAQAAAPRVHKPVGRIAAAFDRRGRTDSSAGRLIADAQWAATRAPERGGAQFALMNPGGVRADLPCRGTPPCTVSFGDAFTMQPFGNNLVVMTLNGSEIKTLLEMQQPARRETPLFLSPSAGLSYRWLAKAAHGQRVQDLKLDGQLLQPDRDYRLTVNNFMADGGDGFSGLSAGRQRLGAAQDLDALVDYLQTGPAPVAEARIEWVE